MPWWLVLPAAYVLGSIPSALMASRLVMGRDIRDLGDGNMGAKNTFHSVGWLPGALVAAADIAKGLLAIELARFARGSEILVMAAGTCAVLGHDFPLFAHFRGGQGMATLVGVFLMMYPGETCFALAALGLVLALTRDWDLSCAASFILLIALLAAGGQPLQRLAYPFLLLPTLGLRKIMQKWPMRF